VCHEARRSRQWAAGQAAKSTYLVMRSSIDLGSRMNVGSTTRLRSAPGRSCEMMCERTGLGQRERSIPRQGRLTISLVGLDDLIFPARGRVLHGRSAWVGNGVRLGHGVR
jgi:hypothetical protein